ncbi:T9SS type A sorting domain-containing protein [Spirosoma fluminis]
MKRISLLLLIWISLAPVWSQSQVMISSSDVRYMVSYEPTTQLYTAWVIPNYNTPNANNPESEDLGATAQFSLKVPKDFVLTNVGDVRGSWDKVPYKLAAPESFASADASNWAYYIIGKTPQETNYGPFVSGEPVALFTFKGKGGSAEQVQVLNIDDEFVQFAESKMALNIRSSFYTRSGQRASTSAHPLEQLSGVIKLDEVLKQKQSQLGLAPTGANEDIATLSVQAYPNPATDLIEVKYFSATEQAGLQLELLDNQGNVKQNSALNAKPGFNSTRFVVSNLPGGVYFVRGMVQGQRVTKKIIKQ